MMDMFKEEVVISRNQTLNSILYMLCWIVLVMLAFSGVMMLQILLYAFDILALALAVFCIGGAVMLFLFKDNFKVEYEYAFTNGVMDFAKVLRNTKRKELGSMTVANVSACGHVAHESFRRYLSMKDVQKKNWFLNRDGNLFYFYYVKENRKNMIIIEPSEEMVDMIRKYLPMGVYQG